MEGKTFYLTIRGQRVEVTEEVYRAYIRLVRKERKRQYRAIGKYSVYSVESIIANGIEVIDENADCESALIEEEERQEELDLLRAALEKLEGRDREIIDMVYFEGKSQTEVARHFNVSNVAICKQIKKIFKKIKDFLPEGVNF